MPYKRAQAKEKYIPKSTRLMDQVREVLRYHHYAIRTEEAYVSWILRFIKFNETRHPKEMGKHEIERFLSHLAMNRNMARNTQDQAMNAILFLYKYVLRMPVNDKIEAVRSRKPKRLPTVLSREEVSRLIKLIPGTHQTMAKLLYGSGLRLLEAVRLRVQDLDFDNKQLMVRDGKGNIDRSTLFPAPVHQPIKSHLERAKALHQEDLRKGYGHVYLPYALERKYTGAARAWNWQYVFPSKNLSVDPRGGAIRRHHSGRVNSSKGCKKSVKQRWHYQKSKPSYLTSFFCNPLIRIGCKYPYCAGAIRAQRRLDH